MFTRSIVGMMLCVSAVAAAPARAQTFPCTSDADCSPMNNDNPCNKFVWTCSNPVVEGNCNPTVTHLAAGTPCDSDGNPCTVDACDGSYDLTACHHNVVAGAHTCGAACIPDGSCCTNADCPAPVGGNGSGVCPAPAAPCTFACSAGYKACGAGCIANAMCCTNADCPADTANHRTGACTVSGCAYQCEAGYKVCGATCIPNGQCCVSSDCTSVPNGCYKSPGTCTAGACSYDYADGVACNADSNACTPNDRCKAGSCVADVGNAVKCIQRECHTAPTCNPGTGNCDDAPLANSTTCGGNGCSASNGSCTNGTCSSMPKDCTALDDGCRVGLCDATQPVGAPCATANKPNGLACAVADKCQLLASCSGGSCVGTPKACMASGVCRLAECNPTTGECEETIAPVGTPCSYAGSCLQVSACNATGDCVGAAAPDGSPCDKADCAATAVCANGACLCLDSPDFGGDPIAGTGGTDLGKPDEPGGSDEHGCSIAARHPMGELVPRVLLVLLLGAIVTRRRHG